jgi:hypothetical protein
VNDEETATAGASSPQARNNMLKARLTHSPCLKTPVRVADGALRQQRTGIKNRAKLGGRWPAAPVVGRSELGGVARRHDIGRSATTRLARMARSGCPCGKVFCKDPNSQAVPLTPAPPGDRASAGKVARRDCAGSVLCHRPRRHGEMANFQPVRSSARREPVYVTIMKLDRQTSAWTVFDFGETV